MIESNILISNLNDYHLNLLKHYGKITNITIGMFFPMVKDNKDVVHSKIFTNSNSLYGVNVFSNKHGFGFEFSMHLAFHTKQ